MAARLRKQASAQRRAERAAKRTGKDITKRIRKANARIDKQTANVIGKRRKKIIAGLQEAVDVAKVAQDAFNEVMNLQVGDAMTINAKYEGMNAERKRHDDEIVCSIIGSYETDAHRFPCNAPWTLSGAEMRSLMEVLHRAGYSMFGAPIDATSDKTKTDRADCCNGVAGVA